MGQLQFIVIHSVHKQRGCNYHTNAIRTVLRITDLLVHIYMFRPLTGHQEDFPSSSSKVINASSVHEYYVIKSGYDENRLTKQNHLTALLNRQKR